MLRILSRGILFLLVALPALPACGNNNASGPAPVPDASADVVEPEEDASVEDAPMTTGVAPCEPRPCVVTVAGKAYSPEQIDAGVVTFADGPGSEAIFNGPMAVAVNSHGNIIVADELNHRIRLINCEGADCTVKTIAGGAQGFADGPGVAAKFLNPVGLAVDEENAIYVAEWKGNRVRKIVCSPGGCEVSTVAGTGVAGHADGPANSATFAQLDGITYLNGDLYVVQADRASIRKIACSADCAVSTIAGDGTIGYKDGPALTAKFDAPTDVTADGQGRLFVADWLGGRIRMIENDTVSTYAGSGGEESVDGPLLTAAFHHPRRLAWWKADIFFVAEQGNHAIRMLADGQATRIAGSGVAGETGLGHRDGPAKDALFRAPRGVAVDPAGVVYVADTDNSVIRAIFR